MQKRSVFHDPTGLRRSRMGHAVRAGALIAGLFLVLVVLAAVSNPQLPRLGLTAVQHISGVSEVATIIHGERAEKNVPFKLKKSVRDLKQDLKYVRGNSALSRPVRAARETEGKPMVVGFYVNWDRSAIVSLRLNIRHLTHLAPEWLVLKNAKGELEDEADQAVIDIAREAHLPILAMVTNYRNGWQKQELHNVLRSPEARTNLVDSIYSNLAEHNFAGVMLDLEQAMPADRDLLTDLVAELRSRLRPKGLMVAQSVPTEDRAYDLRKLTELNDFVMPMVYDEHYQSGTPGPIASQEWFEKQLDQIAAAVPPEKTVIGIGNYGYNWQIGSQGGVEVSFNDVMAAAVANKAGVEWDDDTGNPVLRYKNAGEEHEVWFLDAVTALNHVLEVDDRGFRGVGVWRLGGEDPELWKVLAQAQWPKRDMNLDGLLALTVQQSINQYGEGEIIRIAETPKSGRRRVWRDSTGSFDEQYLALPTYYVVEGYGRAVGKVLAITFDDGPDAEFSTRVLDILNNKGVKATFFVVGANAEEEPGLLRRMYAEGHEIGNHTYSHPNIALTSQERTEIELTATQRIIEHAIGRSTLLFRPPYNGDSEPQTPEEILPVLRAQQLGYITVGERIDPQDWQKDATAAGILHEIIEEKDNGNILLLHDGGGDRNATVEALPRIIDHFRREGYRFVTVGELLGKTKDQIMPPPMEQEQKWALVEGEALDLKGTAKHLLGLIFVSAIVLTMLRSLVFSAMALIEKARVRKRIFVEGYRPAVSVVIAAYNEEKVIQRTVESVLNNSQDDLELIVVDDGSKDATLSILNKAFGNDPRVIILSQENSGKATALNQAIAAASNEVIVAVDADTIFVRDTVAKLARHFADPQVGAVSGNAKVGNKLNWLTRFQSIEYIYGFNLDRRALDLINAITVVPGAVGAWRRSLILASGGLSNDTLAEDADLTLTIRRKGYQIRYEEEAVAYTEAPEDVKSLAKQRFRWAYGTLQAAWKHRDATFAWRYGSLGMVALPGIWVFQVLLGVLSPLADLTMLATLALGNWHVVLLYYMVFFLVELATGFLAYSLEGEKPRDLSLLFFQRLFYRQLMHYVLLKSIVYAVQGRLIGWGTLERRASVAR